MDTDMNDSDLIVRLKKLDAAAAVDAPGFGFDAMFERHAAKQVRARRRLTIARGAASALVVALIGASVWRLDRGATEAPMTADTPAAVESGEPQQRIVRADTYLAVATLEDHLASIDDALTDARASGGIADVARLERTRAELFDSYSRVRYAELVSANF